MILYTKNNRDTSELTFLSAPKLLYICDLDTVEFSVTHRVTHMHDHLELMYIYEGSGSIAVSEKEYAVQKGDLMIYNSGTMHDENPATSRLGAVCIGVSHLCLPQLPPNCLISSQHPPLIHCGKIADYLYQLFQSLITLMSSAMPGHETVSNYLMLTILSMSLELSRARTSAETAKKTAVKKMTASSKICGRVKEYLQQNYTHELTLDMISEAVLVSPYHMSRVFKSETGCTPMQYAGRLRLGKAQTLLVHTPLSITDIAFQVGYNNSCSFNYAFRKMFGITPAEFRRLYRV